METGLVGLGTGDSMLGMNVGSSPVPWRNGGSGSCMWCGRGNVAGTEAMVTGTAMLTLFNEEGNFQPEAPHGNVTTI